MAFQKTTYVIGDILSADKVNEIQDAIISAEKAIEELQKGGGGGSSVIKTISRNVNIIEAHIIGQFESEG